MTHMLDITREHCPMTFVKVKVALTRMPKGDVLDVLLCEGEPLVNVPKSAAEQGQKILSVEKAGEHFRVLIQKLAD